VEAAAGVGGVVVEGAAVPEAVEVFSVMMTMMTMKKMTRTSISGCRT
jgi:hypothetical protein